MNVKGIRTRWRGEVMHDSRVYKQIGKRSAQLLILLFVLRHDYEDRERWVDG